MEDGSRKRDEQDGDVSSQPGSAIGECQGIELPGYAVKGEPCVDRLDISDIGSADIGMSKTEEDATLDLGDSVVRDDPGVGSILNLNSTTTSDQRDLQPRSHSLQSTLKLGDAVEDDARAVARSLTALLSSLKFALSEVTGSSLEHMRFENEAAGQVQDVAIDAATKGNRFINACLRYSLKTTLVQTVVIPEVGRLNEEMKGMSRLATQLESLKQKVDQFEYQSNRYLPRQ